MHKAKKHSTNEKLAIVNITLAELVPAELISKSASNYIVSSYSKEYFMGNVLSLQASAAYIKDASIIIPVVALAVAIPLLYTIESKLFDKVYVPAAKKLYSMLRHDRYKKDSESFK
jgi:hypothetical protein